MTDSSEQSSVMRVPPPPHFVDEETLVTARPVIPIETANARERSRVVRHALPFILVAGFVGILLGGAAGYYRRRGAASANVNRSAVTQLPQTVPQRGEETNRTAQSVSSNETSTPIESAGTVTADEKAEEHRVTESANPGVFPLSKRRRVRSDASETGKLPREPRARRPHRGAGRIEEIFSGSVPP